MTAPLDAVMAVMEAAFDPCHGEAWTRAQLAGALTLRSTGLHLAGPDGAVPRAGGPVVGFALTRAVLDEEELLLLAVHPAMRGLGIGRALLDRFVAAARTRGATRLFLEMRDGNPARALYRRAGFVEVGRRRDYYRRGRAGPVDAITFALSC